MIKEILNNDFSRVKILREGEYDSHPEAIRRKQRGDPQAGGCCNIF